jgi:hypothetical protein
LKYYFYSAPGGATEYGAVPEGDSTSLDNLNYYLRNRVVGESRNWWAMVKEVASREEAMQYSTLLNNLFMSPNVASPYGALWTQWFTTVRATLNEGNLWGIPEEMVNLPWAGLYAPFTRTTRGLQSPLLERGVPLYTNYALALRASIKHIIENGIENVYPSVLIFPTVFMPTVSPEVIGEVAKVNTVKDLTPEDVGKCCSNCGLIGCKSNTCARPAKAHLKVGIEVEGRWRNLSSVITKARELTGGDGYCDASLRTCTVTGASPWEFQTKPGNLREALEQLVILYPDSVDERCGMHVHVSFNETDTGLLYSKEFFKLVTERMTAWGNEHKLDPQSEFFKRLTGANTYCAPNKTDKGQVISTAKYSQVNFSAWSKQKTVEYRSLPMFRKASLGVSAIKELLTIYEDFLGGDHGNLEKVAPKIVVAPSAKEIEELTSKNPKRIVGEIPWAPIKTAIVREIEVTLPPPVAPGARRVAIPKGPINPASAGRGYVLKQNGLGGV